MVATYDHEHAQPTHRAVMTAGGVSRSELLVWGPQLETTTLSWFDADPAAVERLLERVDTVIEFHLVAGDGGSYAFTDRESTEFDSAVLSRIAESQLVFVPPLSFHENGEIRVEVVGEQSRLAAFFDAVRGLIDIRLEAVHSFDRHGQAATVTDRQRQALSAAADVGYYELPRTGSVADVASELGCAHSTAGELLRKAEISVVRGFLDGVG